MKRNRLFKLLLTILLSITFSRLLSYFFLYMDYFTTNFYIVKNLILIVLPIILISFLVVKKMKIDIMIFPLAIAATIVAGLPAIIFTDNIQVGLIFVAGLLVINLTLLCWGYITTIVIYKNIPKYLDIEVKYKFHLL